MSTADLQTQIDAAQNSQAVDLLSSLLDKNLRIHVSDGRMFIGQMKCTDRDSNYVLGNAHEYREPTPKQIRDAAANVQKSDASVKVDVNCRYVGLIVVPGEHIRRIEVEEFDPAMVS